MSRQCGSAAIAFNWGAADGSLDTGTVGPDGTVVFTFPGVYLGLDECQFDLEGSGGAGTEADPLVLCPNCNNGNSIKVI